jgi:hypothetical protein
MDSGTSQVQGLVTFTGGDTSSAVVFSGAPVSTPNLCVKGDVSDLTTYLSRPYRVSSFILNSTRGSVVTYPINYAFLAGPGWLSRMQGAFGFRATLVFRLDVAVTPFHGGIVKLAWLPQADDAGNWDRGSHVSLIYQLPGVVMNLADTSTCTLRIPWVNSSDCFSLELNNPSQFGRLWVYNLTSPSIGATGVLPGCTLRASLEDVELIGYYPRSTFTWTPQSGLSAPAKETAKLSTALAVGSKVAALIAPLTAPIPYLSSLLGSTSWALNILSNTAKAFGWSKPIVVVPNRRVFTTTHNYSNNSDAADAGYSLGVLSDAAITVQPGFAGNGLDEMAISFIASRPSIVSSANWTTSTAAGVCVYLGFLDPMSMYYRNVNNVNPDQGAQITNKVFVPSSLFFLSNMFKLWRGSFVFTFSLNKTQYHTGRLLITHVPEQATMALAYPDITVPNLCKSALWDISETTTFEFVVPFIRVRPYCPRYSGIGTISVVVENPLNCPSTVSSSVEMMVTVAGGDDWEVAQPTSLGFYQAPNQSNVYFWQSGIEAAETCIGERVMSIKQLLLRMAPINVFSGLCVQDISPWFSIPKNTWLGTNGTLQWNSVGVHSYLSAAYVYARGGTRIAFRPFVTSVVTIRNQSLSVPDDNCGSVFEAGTACYATAPYYNTNSRTLISDAAILDETGNNVRTSVAAYPISNFNVASSGRLDIAASDDAHLGYWIGPPPLCFPILNGNAASPYYDIYTPQPIINTTRARLSIVSPGVAPTIPRYVAP